MLDSALLRPTLQFSLHNKFYVGLTAVLQMLVLIYRSLLYNNCMKNNDTHCHKTTFNRAARNHLKKVEIML